MDPLIDPLGDNIYDIPNLPPSSKDKKKKPKLKIFSTMRKELLKIFVLFVLVFVLYNQQVYMLINNFLLILNDENGVLSIKGSFIMAVIVSVVYYVLMKVI